MLVEMLKNNVESFIMVILGIMSFISIWFLIERVIFFRKIDLSHFKNSDELEIALSKNLTALYIIYSNAPYIGLLGTVAGIMITFYDMGLSQTIDAKTIMIGLSLALKATATGLLVAIPTLMIYNALNRKVDVLLSKFRNQYEI